MATFCAFMLLAGHAQLAEAQSIGFKVGPTFSTVDTDPDSEETEYLTSFGGGGFVRFGLAGLALQAELLAVTKGFQVADVGGADKVKVTYIEVPVSVMFPIGNGPYIFAGGSVGFESSCKIEEGDQDFDCDDEEDGEQRKSTDFSVLGGAGLQFRAGPGSILLEGRYTWGLTNLNDSPTDPFKIRNRSIAAFVGYSIPIGR